MWEPEYGCALTIYSPPFGLHNMFYLNLIGLDEYAFCMHGPNRESKYSHTGVPHEHVILHIGSIQKEDYPEFEKR